MGRRGTLQEIEERKAVTQKTESTRYERVQLRLRKEVVFLLHTLVTILTQLPTLLTRLVHIRTLFLLLRIQ